MTEHRVNPLQWLSTKFASLNHSHSEYLTEHQDIAGKENIDNKVTSWSSPATDTHYPSEKLIKDSLDNLNSNLNTAMTNLGSNINTAISTVNNRISNLNTSNIISSGESLNNIGSYSGTVPQSTINGGINTQLGTINTKISSISTSKHILEATRALDGSRVNLTINLPYLTTITDPSIDFSPLYVKLPNDMASTTGGVRFIIKYNNGNSTFPTQQLYDINGSSGIRENVLSANEIIIIGWDSNKLKLLKILGKEYSTVAETGSYNDLTDKPTIPTATSDLVNDSGFLINHQDISGKEDKSNKVTSLDAFSTDTEYPSAKAVYDELWTNLYGTIQNDYNDYVPNSSLGSAAFSNDYEDLDNLPQLGNLAYENDVDLSGHDLDELSDNTNLLFSGDYDDLDNKPTIPTATSDLSNDGDGTGPFLTGHDLTNYLQKSDVKDNLTSTDTNKPLSALQGNTLKSLVDTKQDTIKSITVTNDGRLYLLTQAPRYITYSNTKTMLAYENDYGDISITVTDENHEIIEGAEVQFYIIFGDGSSSPTRYLYTDNTGTCTTRVFSEELSTSYNQINIKYGEYTSRYNMGREPNIIIDDLDIPL